MRSNLISGFLLGLLLCSAAQCGNLSIDSSDYRRSDVNVAPSIPVAGEPATVRIKVHNKAAAAGNVTVSVQDASSGRQIGRAQILVPASGSAVAEVPWKPATTGWHDIRVTAGDAKAAISVPVVYRRLYFPWFNCGGENEQRLRWANVVITPKPENQEYWAGRGAIPCFWRGVAGEKMTADQYKDALYSGIPGTGIKGIMLDEVGGYSDYQASQTNTYAGLSKFTEEHPEVFTAVWHAGSLTSSYCNITKNVYRPKGIDLLMLESYFSYQVVDFNSYTRYAYFDQRINMARNQDVLDHAVMTLGVTGNEDKYKHNPADLEDQVRYIRDKAPEMPGVGYFCTNTKNIAILDCADNMCLKYFINPVITVWDRDILLSNPTPGPGEVVDVKASVFNIGGMDSGAIKVSFYDGDPRYGGKRIGSTIKQASVKVGAGIPSGQCNFTVKWRAQPGYRDIFVEVVPVGSRITILNGMAKRSVYVRGAQ